MKITEIFKRQSKTYSFEFYPPKDEISAVDFGINVGQLMKLNPSFVSVTYGAGGSTQNRTFALVDYLQNKIGMTVMAHYTCVNATRSRVKHDLEYLKEIGIENLMLLRGDPPKEMENTAFLNGEFKYASELIDFAGKSHDFCRGGACYVEKHPEASTLEEDIENLKRKVDAGVDFLITQLFFINENYYRFVEKVAKTGIRCRIIPGIIPITSYRQIERFTKMSGSVIPIELAENIEKYKEDPFSSHLAGIEYAVKQCYDLLKNDSPGLHFYTLNKSRAAIEIFEILSPSINLLFNK